MKKMVLSMWAILLVLVLAGCDNLAPGPDPAGDGSVVINENSHVISPFLRGGAIHNLLDSNGNSVLVAIGLAKSFNAVCEGVETRSATPSAETEIVGTPPIGKCYWTVTTIDDQVVRFDNNKLSFSGKEAVPDGIYMQY